jgi:hypothetical protein
VDARVTGNASVESRGVARESTHVLAALREFDSGGRHTGGDAARLKNEDDSFAADPRVDERRRQARGLSRAGFGGGGSPSMRDQRLDGVVEMGVDGKAQPVGLAGVRTNRPNR